MSKIAALLPCMSLMQTQNSQGQAEAVRYVGGYVVAKLKFRNSKRLSSKRFAQGKQKETYFFY